MNMPTPTPPWRIFLRHAHRELFDRSADNGLSEKGHKQGLKLQEWLEKNAPRPKSLFSSPKRRCLETAQYVAELYQLEIQILPELDEQGPQESDASFLKRVSSFLHSPHFLPEAVYCSHGDVLPALARLLGSPGIEISKGDLFVERDGTVSAINPVRG
jgi:broad specificity phosphatase PhoE